MFYRSRGAKVNVKVLVVLIVVTVALGVSLVAARQIRRSILSQRDLQAGQAAFEKQDWREAVKNYREYLGRKPGDVEILRKHAQACLSIRPLDAAAITGAISAYRRVVQLDPRDQAAYAELARLYPATGNFEELAYIARARIARDPNDRKAPLWLAQALVQLNKTQEAEQTLQKLIDTLQALPDKPVEYVQACVQMSDLVRDDRSPDAQSKALGWLNQAVKKDDPISAEALAHRARFYREASGLPGMSAQARLASARDDLEAADALGTKDPRMCYFLGAEWMAHGELKRAAAELQTVENLPREALEEHFRDINDWTVARFLFASELALRRGTPADAVSLADEALTALTEKRHRVRVLPSAIRLYVAVGKVAEARRCLDEYLDILHTLQGITESPARLGWLRALVARAEDRPYVVIDAVQPIVATDVSRPELWGLLAEAYVRTDRSRQAVGAMLQYLHSYPQDLDMTLQLAREYSKLGDWDKAFKTAQRAESLNPASTATKLVRIGTGIYLAAEQGQTPDKAKLEEFSGQLTQLRREHPDQVDIRTLQSSIADYLGQPDQAERELRLAIQECKEPLKAEMQLVRHCSQGKKLTEAAAVCRAACERHPEVAEPWLSLAELHVANADYEAARQCLRQGLDAVGSKPQKGSLSMRLALLELTQGDRAAGIRLLNELAAQDEQEIRARLLLLGTREIQGDRPAAERLVGELKQIEGESGLWWRLHQASLWLSSDAWRSKQQDITSMLQYCITADAEWPAPVLLLAAMYERSGDLQRVEDTCRQALAHNPAALDIADKLLTLLERQGRFVEAQQVLQQAKVTPQVSGAWSIRMAIQAGDVSRAIDELRLRVSSDPQDANPRIQLARLVYQQTKDADQALRYLKEAETITPDSRTLIWTRASILAAEGRGDEAQRILDDYVAKHNDFNAYWTRGSYLAMQGKSELAEKDFRKLTTLAEGGAKGYELLCNFYTYYRKLDQAITTAEEGVSAYRDELRLQRKLMQLLFLRAQAQDRERALAILATLEERLPQDSELMTIRAVQMAAEATPQSLAAARERLEKAVQMEPTAVNAHLALTQIALQQRDYQAARDFAMRALGFNPKNLALLSARSRAELALTNTALAVELSHLVLQEDPNSVDALDVLAQAALSSKNRDLLQEARTRIESFVRRDPANERLLIWHAYILASLEEPRKAVAGLEAYCQGEKGSRSVAALVTLANLYRLGGDLDRAGQRIEQAERLDAKNLTVDVRLGLASGLYQTGDAEGAEKIYREMLDQHPDDIRVLNDLAWVLQEHHQQYAEALDLANKGLRVAPGDLHLLDTRGTILSNMPDRRDDARRDFQKLADLSPVGTAQQAKAFLQLGRVCAKLGDLAQAKQHVEKALDIDSKVSVFTVEERSEIAKIIEQSGAQPKQ